MTRTLTFKGYFLFKKNHQYLICITRTDAGLNNEKINEKLFDCFCFMDQRDIYRSSFQYYLFSMTNMTIQHEKTEMFFPRKSQTLLFAQLWNKSFLMESC